MIAVLLVQALLTLKLSTTTGIAPVITYARVSVDASIRGQVCLRWTSEETIGVEESCWRAETNPHTVWRNIRITEPGTWKLWAESEKAKSNEVQVEVR